jgi:hypothetical protein
MIGGEPMWLMFRATSPWAKDIVANDTAPPDLLRMLCEGNEVLMLISRDHTTSQCPLRPSLDQHLGLVVLPTIRIAKRADLNLVSGHPGLHQGDTNGIGTAVG